VENQGRVRVRRRDTGGEGSTVAEVAADSISARHGIRAAITDARKQNRNDDGGGFVALPVS